MKNKSFVIFLLILTSACLPLKAEGKTFPISFRLYGGASFIGGGDLNDGLQGWADYWKANYPHIGHPYIAGAYNPVHLGVDLGIDVLYQISPRVSVGLGAEFLMAKRTTNMTFQPDIDWAYFGQPSAVPIKLSGFYFLPAGNRLKVVLHAGLGYYLAKARLESHVKPPNAIDYVIDSSAAGIGFHGGVGLEWEFSSHLSLLIEGAGRYASISGFEGTTTVTDSSGSGSWDGKLYYFGASRSYAADYNYIDLLAGEPGGSWLKFKRDAKVDFSGFALRLGIIVRL